MNIAIIPLVAAAAAAQVSVTRTVSEAEDVGPRIRRLERSWLFSERQPYMPLYNFIPQKYIDRPLFTDISLRREPDSMKAGFMRDIEVLKWSGFDGFGSIAYTPIYHRQLGYFEKDPVESYVQFPILWNFYQPLKRDSSHYEELKRMIVAAAKSKQTMKIDGRPMVWMWGSASDRHHQGMKLLKEDPEIPPFVCFVMDPFLDAYVEFTEKTPGKLSRAAVDAYRAKCEELLSWADGFKVRVCERLGVHEGEHGRYAFIDPLYRDYLCPVLREIFDRPENAKKYIGVELEQAYVNHLNGPTLSQCGTATLRNFWDGAMMLNPDVLVGFEWNEANENTSFQPTASGAGAVARVCAYYKAMLNGGRLSPRPGDDVSIPNLVVSTRRSLISGERYHVEFLYVPDGVEVGPFRARVVVRDDAGAVRAECPWESLPVAKLTAFDYRMDGDGFAGANALYPVVEVEKDGVVTTYAGFDSAKINPTWCVDYLYTRTPLRELIRSPKADLAVKAAADGVYEFRASFACDEELASVEIMEGNAEKVVADRENRFDRTKYDIFRGTFTHKDPLELKSAVFDVEGSDAWILSDTGMPWPVFHLKDTKPAAGPRKVDINGGGAVEPFLFAVPKGDVGRAKFRMWLPSHAEQEPVSLAELKRKGRILLSWPKTNVHLELERLDMTPDYAVPLNAKSASIEAKLPAVSAHPVFHLRAIAKSGHVWRSEPVVPVKGLEKVDLDYDFADDSYGAFLPVRQGERYWWGRLGGGWDAAGQMWWEAVRGWQKDRLTKDCASVFPKRVKEDGSAALSFDGRGQYVIFPRETFPCDREFAVEFSMKALSATNQVLLRVVDGAGDEQNVRLLVEDGALRITHFGRTYGVMHDYRTDLKIRPGKWQTVRLVRGKGRLELSLDGEKRGYECQFPARNVQSVIFGANVHNGVGMKGEYRPFCGFLRSFHVVHGSR